jgi:TfoX/Sxy family transcriptional regulator of competence genes
VPYDEGLAQRLREYLGSVADVEEKKMFGGLAFMVSGHMACGIVAEDLMVRVGPAAYHRVLVEPHAREMDFTGRALKGFVYVAPAGFEADEALSAWVDRALSFVESLPPR